MNVVNGLASVCWVSGIGMSPARSIQGQHSIQFFIGKFMENDHYLVPMIYGAYERRKC